MRAIVADLLAVAFSAGGDGGRGSPEREIPHTSFTAASDCRTIAIYVFALVQRRRGIAHCCLGALDIALAVEANEFGLGHIANAPRCEHFIYRVAQLVALAPDLVQLLAQGVTLALQCG